MERLCLFLATAAVAACSASSAPASSALSCVPTSCGCSILVESGSCPGGGAHFFHELADGSPLQFNAGQGPVTVTSARAQSDTFTPAPGDSWSEVYRDSGGNVEIHYTPGDNTCSKLAHGEQCEYFDVRAEVLLSSPQGLRRYSGVGTCGC